MLQLKEVVKRYRGSGEEVSAIDGVSLSVAPGEALALVGPSGSGKTTLLLLIAGLLRPDEGAIRYGDLDVGSLSEQMASRYLLRDVGFIFQRFRLMPHVSALENAAQKLLLSGVGLRQAQERAAPWLERVGLCDRMDRPPERLSGGEQQRVAIARALACEPSLILADEPTGNLDSRRSAEVAQLLVSIAHDRGACVLLVTHDREAAAAADRVVALRDGQIAEEPALSTEATSPVR